MRADINVFDVDIVAETHPYRVTDFPPAHRDSLKAASATKATLVNGEFHVIDGELTDARTGQLLRHRR